MKKIFTKKGIVFTLLSVILSAIILTTFFFNQQLPVDTDIGKTSIRINSINQFLKEMDTYIEHQMISTSREVFENMTYYMIYNSPSSSYFPSGSGNFTTQFFSCHKYGTLITPSGASMPCSDGLQSRLDEMDQLALSQLNIPSKMTVENMKIYQVEPWNVVFEAQITIDINDSFAKWNLINNYTVNVSIFDLPDPTYGVNIHVNTRPFNYALNFTTRTENVNWTYSPSTLNIFALNKYYFAYPNGPSFLDRMQGDLSAKGGPAGIVSVIIPTHKHYESNIPHVDYMYWTQTACSGTEYRTFDFFNLSSSTTEIRSEINITEDPDDYSINMAVLPYDLINQSLMDNTDYYFTTICP